VSSRSGLNLQFGWKPNLRSIDS